MRILIIAAATIAVCIAALQPTVQVSPDSVIVNTAISSSIIDAQGVAIAVAPLTCGVDSTIWCEVADSINSNK